MFRHSSLSLIGEGSSRAAVVKKRSLREIFMGTFRMPSLKLNSISSPKRHGHELAVPVFKSASCPVLPTYRRELLRDDRSQFINDNWMKARSATNFPKPYEIETQPALLPVKPSKTDVPIKSDIVVPAMFESLVGAACPTPCPTPCPSPCCGPCGPCCGNMADCNCGRLLPPPCNTPPKCIQYMQGYYYYPYGTWFCGPYHVNTGSVPCCGPVCPGTTCGIAPPNPNLLCSQCGPCGGPCGPCCCGLLGCTLCNPPTSGGSGGAGPLGTPFPPGPWNSSATGPNATSYFGACEIPCTQGFGMPSPQGFGMPSPQGFGMPSPQGFGMPSPQGFAGMPSQGCCGLPCSQESWTQPHGSMAPGSPPIPFGVPGCTTQSPMPCGSGFNVSFSPVPIFSPSESQTMPSSASFSCPVTPQWATDHGPCESDCVANRSGSRIEQTKSVPQVDTPKVMRSIVEPVSKTFALKKPKNINEQCKRPEYNRILDNPKVKATFP